MGGLPRWRLRRLARGWCQRAAAQRRQRLQALNELLVAQGDLLAQRLVPHRRATPSRNQLGIAGDGVAPVGCRAHFAAQHQSVQPRRIQPGQWLDLSDIRKVAGPRPRALWAALNVDSFGNPLASGRWRMKTMGGARSEESNGAAPGPSDPSS